VDRVQAVEGAVVRHVSHVTDRVWRLGSVSRNPVDLPPAVQRSVDAVPGGAPARGV